MSSVCSWICLSTKSLARAFSWLWQSLLRAAIGLGFRCTYPYRISMSILIAIAIGYSLSVKSQVREVTLR